MLSLLAAPVTQTGTATCRDLHQAYQASSCCNSNIDQSTGYSLASGTTSGPPYEPPISGVMPGRVRPKIILGQDIDWPPYAFLSVPPNGDFMLGGFGNDIAHGLSSVCDIDIVTRQVSWNDCWGSNVIGPSLDNGIFHGCMTYTHTQGVRNRYMEFTNAILDENKPAGILTRLGSDGKPVIDPMSDLSGVNIVDVAGWAPTAEGLQLVNNFCTGGRFNGFNLITPPTTGNDAAMAMLMNGTADGMFVYADQAYNYRPNQPNVVPSWDTNLWTGLGTQFAYIHTGMFAHTINGTTLAVSKKGSGLKDILDPCIERFLGTRMYYEICTNHSLTNDCFRNAHFPTATASASLPWTLATNAQSAGCADGYCSCAVGVTTDTNA